MIDEHKRAEIQKIILRIFRESTSLAWMKIEEGYTNKNYRIINEKGIPLAVCKFFIEDEIHTSSERFTRELMALETFSGTLAPELIFHDNSQILVYKYVEGIELHKLPPENINSSKLEKAINKMLSLSKAKRKTTRSNVTSYYDNLLAKYLHSKVEYPKKLLRKFKDLTMEQKEILDDYNEHLTYVHGDLIPPNFICNNQSITFLDWEFSRPELTFFDQQYFNYYAKAHSLPINIGIEPKVKVFYNELVDVLERLWRYGYEASNGEIFYHI